MAESRMVEVAEELLRRSKAGDLAWERRGPRDSYGVSLSDISLIIFHPGRDEYLLSLRDIGNEVIESLYLEERGVTGFSTLEELFDIARRQALDVEGNIDRALEYLKRS